MPNAQKISVIIPTLNEAENLPTTLDCINSATHIHNQVEVIITDGGSTDNTVEIAQKAGAKVIPSSPGRANQLNTGAAQATGDIYLFLHADTQLPNDWQTQIESTLAQPNTIAGAFQLKINSPQRGIALVEWGVQIRSRFFHLPYGDQGIFLKAATFQQLGGFPDLAIMEDYQFIQQLKQHGKISISPTYVITSGRRWETLGVLPTTVLNQIMILGFYAGIKPEQLKSWYRNAAQRIRQF